MCNSLHPARVDALSEGAGTPKVPPEPAKGRREDPVPSTEENLARFEGAPWAFGARFSVPRTASTATFRSSRYQLGSHPFPGELAAKLCSKLFFPGSAAVAAGHLVCRGVFESYPNLNPHAGTPNGVGEFDWPTATAADP